MPTPRCLVMTRTATIVAAISPEGAAVVDRLADRAAAGDAIVVLTGPTPRRWRIAQRDADACAHLVRALGQVVLEQQSAVVSEPARAPRRRGRPVRSRTPAAAETRSVAIAELEPAAAPAEASVPAEAADTAPAAAVTAVEPPVLDATMVASLAAEAPPPA